MLPISRRSLPVTLCAAIPAILFAPGPLAAQQGGAVWETWSTFPAPWWPAPSFGESAAAVGDLDRDGIAEVAIGDPRVAVGGTYGSGAVAVFSGTDGRLLWQVQGQGYAWNLGAAVTGPGDVDGDGVPDLAASAAGFSIPGLVDGTVLLYSGRDGRLLRRLDHDIQAGLNSSDYGEALAGVGDLDGDGCGDLAVGAPGEDSNTGAVILRSGRTGRVLRILTLAESGLPLFGMAVSSPGDVTGDGVPEVAVGAPGTNPGGRWDAGSVLLHDGRTGVLLWRADGSEAGAALGQALAPAGDVDGDGRGDVLAGAPGEQAVPWQATGVSHVLSGADGRVLHRLALAGSEVRGLGGAVAGGRDLDGDGVPDLVVGAPDSSPVSGASYGGLVLVFSGAGGNLLYTVPGTRSDAGLGSAVALLGDANGDGLEDLLATASGSSGLQDSRGMILGLRPFLGPRTQSLPYRGGAVFWDLAFGPRTAFWTYQILASARGTGPVPWQGLEVPLTPDLLFAASVAGRYPIWAPGFRGVLGPDGTGVAALVPSPGDLPPGLAGRDLFLAAVAGPAGLPPELVSLAAVLHVEP